MSDDGPSGFRAWRASKCYEGQGPFVLWQVLTGDAGKQILVADATQRSFGVRLEAARTEDLKVDGAVVTTLRKHARTGGIGRIFKHLPTGDIWIPIHTTRGEIADLFVQLAMAAPPEIRVIDRERTVLVRKSSQGTYTKRRTLETPLLHELPAAELEDLSGAILSTAVKRDEADAEPAPTGAEVALPDYQRDARDRLSRRVKTVRKAASRRSSEKQQADRESTLKADAEILRDHLHLIKPDAFELTVEVDGRTVTLDIDPELTPGQNLEAYYTRVKKARRATSALGEQAEDAEKSLVGMEADLARLRAAPLAKTDVQAILKRHKLPLDKPMAKDAAGEPVSLPYRTYALKATTGTRVEMRVGRSAETSDELVKSSKTNDYWVHAVGVTGSHVVIPAAPLSKSGDLTPALIRAAAILALHHSKVQKDHAGEVYFTRRQHIRKRKGMAPGLWQVDKAETLYFRYDDDELQEVLGCLEP